METGPRVEGEPQQVEAVSRGREWLAQEGTRHQQELEGINPLAKQLAEAFSSPTPEQTSGVVELIRFYAGQPGMRE